MLLWNGEVFGGLEVRAGLTFLGKGPLCVLSRLLCVQIPYDSCDTTVVLQRLREAVSRDPLSVMDVMSSVRGPFAFVYYHVRDVCYVSPTCRFYCVCVPSGSEWIVVVWSGSSGATIVAVPFPHSL